MNQFLLESRKIWVKSGSYFLVVLVVCSWFGNLLRKLPELLEKSPAGSILSSEIVKKLPRVESKRICDLAKNYQNYLKLKNFRIQVV